MADKWYKEVKPVTSFDEIERQLKRNQFSQQARAQMGVRPKGEVDEEGNPVPNPNSLLAANAKAIAIGAGEFVGTPLMRVLGFDDLADDMSRVNQAIQGAVAERDDETVVPNVLMRGVRGVGSQIPGMIVGGTAGRMGPIAIAAGGEQSRGYTQARDLGEDHSSASGLSLLRAANEAGTTAIFGKLGMGGAETAAASIGRRLTSQAAKEGGKEMAGLTASHIAKRAAITALQEIPEEITIESLHAAIDYHYGLDPKAMDAGELLDRAIDTAVQAAMMGGSMGGLHGAAEFMDQPRANRPAGQDAKAPVEPKPGAVSAPASPEIVSQIESILSDGKPRSIAQIMQEFVDQGGSLTEFGSIMSHLDRQVGKGVIESTDDGKYYAVKPDADTESDEADTIIEELDEVNRKLEQDLRDGKEPDAELVRRKKELQQAFKGLPETEDDTVSDVGSQPESDEASEYPPGSEPDSRPLTEIEAEEAAKTAPAGATEGATETARKPLADMTPEEVEAEWRKAVPDAPRRAPAKSTMIDQIETIEQSNNLTQAFANVPDANIDPANPIAELFKGTNILDNYLDDPTFVEAKDEVVKRLVGSGFAIDEAGAIADTLAKDGVAAFNGKGQTTTDPKQQKLNPNESTTGSAEADAKLASLGRREDEIAAELQTVKPRSAEKKRLLDELQQIANSKAAIDRDARSGSQSAPKSTKFYRAEEPGGKPFEAGNVNTGNYWFDSPEAVKDFISKQASPEKWKAYEADVTDQELRGAIEDANIRGKGAYILPPSVRQKMREIQDGDTGLASRPTPESKPKAGLGTKAEPKPEQLPPGVTSTGKDKYKYGDISIAKERGMFTAQLSDTQQVSGKTLEALVGRIDEAGVKADTVTEPEAKAEQSDADWFAGSKITKKDGTPRVVYHGTTSPDKVPIYSGQHFGTEMSAKNRLSMVGGSKIHAFYLSIKNPLYLKDSEAVDEASLLNAIIRGKVPGADIGVARKEGSYKAAMDAGYDGIIYKNLVEDAGKESFVIFSPEQARVVARESKPGLGKSVPPKPDTVTKSGKQYFDPKAVASAEAEAAEYKSRSIVIELSPDQFLEMAEKLGSDGAADVSPEKTSTVKGVLDRGDKFSSLPFLGFEVDSKSGTAKVVSHEGRHRAMALKQLGVKSMPVVFRGPIRWDQQAAASSFDRVKQWPATLKGETDGEMPFPVPDPIGKPAAELAPKPVAVVAGESKPGLGKPAPKPDTVSADTGGDSLDRNDLRAMMEKLWDEDSESVAPKKAKMGGKPKTGAKPKATRNKPAADKSPPKAKPATREEKRAASKKEADAILAELLRTVNQLNNASVNPELASIAVRFVKAKILEGYHTFAAFVEYVADNFPAAAIRKLQPYLEMAWSVAHQEGLTKDPGGSMYVYGGKNRIQFEPVGDTTNEQFAKVPSDTDAMDALSSDRKPKFGSSRDLAPGTFVAFRIDIPAFERTLKAGKPVYVVTVHEDKGKGGDTVGTPIGYDSMARMSGPVRLSVNPVKAGEIADGTSTKTPIATVKGRFDASREIPKDINEWHAIGMNPVKAPFFYDKKTGREVRLGVDAVSVGNTVFIREITEYGSRNAGSLVAPGTSMGRTAKPTDQHQPTLSERAKTARAEADAILAEFRDHIGNKRMSNLPLDPTAGMIAIRYAKKLVEAEVYTFAEYAKELWSMLSDAHIAMLKPYLEMAWQVAYDKKLAHDKPGDLDDFKPKQPQSESEKTDTQPKETEAPKRYPSALKNYPDKIEDPYSPGRMVDAPPIYLTGKSTDASREAAKTMPNLGVLVTPATANYRNHLGDYEFFGVDNGAFSGKFDERAFYKLLDNIRELGHAAKAIFVAAPDVVGDWAATLKRSEPHLDRIRDAGFPVAIVLQNGATVETVPWDRIDALFVGGDNDFKLAMKDGKLDPKAEMMPIIKEAKKRGVPIHFGRVNSAQRLEMVHFGMLGRSADGTFLNFGKSDEQLEKVKSWLAPWGKFPSKLDTSESTPAKPEPAAESKPSEADVLESAGIEIEKVGPVWRVSGKGTFKHKDLIKTLANNRAFWNGKAKSWEFRKDPTAELVARLNKAGVDGKSKPGETSDAAMDRREARELERERSPDVRRDGSDLAGSVSADTKQLIEQGKNFGIPEHVRNGQIEDIGAVVNAYENARPMMIVGSAPGMGKTFVLGGVIRELRNRGVKKFVYITKSQELIDQVKNNLANYGLEGVEFVTYAGIRNTPIDMRGKVLLSDEAHSMKNMSGQTGKAGARMIRDASFTVFATATPFENVTEAAYMAPSGMFDGVTANVKNYRGNVVKVEGFPAWAWMHGADIFFPDKGPPVLQWRKRQTDVGLQTEANNWLLNRGVYTQRPMSLPPETVKSTMTPVEAEQEYVDLHQTVVDVYDDAISRTKDEGVKSQIMMHGVNLKKRILEASKVKAAITKAKKLLAEGKQVILFVNTKADRHIGRYRLSEVYAKERGIKGKEKDRLYTPVEIDRMMFEHERLVAMAKLSGDTAGPAPFSKMVHEISKAMGRFGVDIEMLSVVDELKAGLPADQIVEFTGRMSPSEAQKGLAAWKSGTKGVIIATMDKGGTGLSFHDTTGKMPERVQLNINLPWSGTQVEQVSGRLARLGTAKQVALDWLFANNIPFERDLTKTVGARLQSMTAAVQGEISEMGEKVHDFDFEDQGTSPSAFNTESLQEDWGLEPEKAEAVVALAEAMGLDTSKIRVAKGKGSGADVLYQLNEASEWLKANFPGQTSNEKEFFGRRVPAALKAAKTLTKGLTKKRQISRAGVEAAAGKFVEDVREFLIQNPEFADYYAKDTDAEIEALVKRFPEMSDTGNFMLYKVLQGMASGGTELSANISESIDAYESVRKHGEVREIKMQGDPKQHSNKQLNYDTINALLGKLKSPEAVLEWLTDTVSPAELRKETRAEFGRGEISGKQVREIKDIVENATGNRSQLPRVFMFGPKIGAYTLNLLGDHRYHTMDIWETRVARSYFEELSKEGLSTPFIKSDAIMKQVAQEWAAKTAELLGIPVDAAQAVRWYYYKRWASQSGYSTRGLNVGSISAETAKRIDQRKADESSVREAGPHSHLRGVGQGAEGSSQASLGKVQQNLGLALRGVNVLYQGEEKALVEFADSGEAILRALKSADVSSAIHELFHVGRRWLFDRSVPAADRAGITDADIALAEKEFGVKDGVWTVEAEERFARAGERYMRDGKSPTKGLQSLFDKFSSWLHDIYTTLSGSSIDIEITPGMRDVFDKMFMRLAPADASTEAEQTPLVRGDVVSWGKQEATVLIPDVGFVQPGAARIEYTTGPQKGQMVDVPAKWLAKLDPEETVAGKAKSAAQKAAAEKAEREARIRAELIAEVKPAVRAMRKGGVNLQPKTKKAQKQLLSDLSIRTDIRNDEILQAAINEVASEPQAFETKETKDGQRENAGSEGAKPVDRQPLTKVGKPGSTGSLILADGSSQEVQYVFVEAEDLIPSHDARRNFAKNEGADDNERPYHDPKQGRSSRETVENIAKSSPDKLALLVADSPSPTDGPPMVTPDGIVLGGNARTMGMQLAYHNGGEAAGRMKQAQIDAAQKFGVDPQAVEGMKHPVVVRVLSHVGQRGELSAILNEALTTGRSRDTMAVSRGKRVSVETATKIGNLLRPGANGEVPSLRDVMRDGSKSDRIIKAFRDDGVWTQKDIDAYVDPKTGDLNEDGKTAIEQTLIGRIVDDPTVVGNATAGTKQKLLSALGPLTRGVSDKTHGAKLAGIIKTAVEAFPGYKASGTPLRQYFLQQQSMFPFPGMGDPNVMAMVGAIDDLGPRQFKAAMDGIVQALGIGDASQEMLFGGDTLALTVDEAIEAELGYSKPKAVKLTDPASGDPVPKKSQSSEPSDNLSKFLSPALQKKQSMGAAKKVVKSASDLVENYDNTPIPAKDSPYKFKNKDVESRFATAMKGLSSRSIRQRLQDFWTAIKKNTARGALAELKRTVENGDARAWLREFRDASHMAAWAVNSLLSRTVEPLQGADVELFTKLVVLRDLKGREGLKPFGLTPEMVESELERFEGMLNDNPRVAAALEFRAEWFESMRTDYIDAHRKLGIDLEKSFTNEDYFRHQVLQYYMVNEGLSPGGAKRKAELAMGRGYLTRAEGSELDINANYIQAEWEVATQIIADTKRAQLLYKIEQRYNIRDRLKNQAKVKNFETLAGGKDVVKRINELREKKNSAKGAALKTIIEELQRIDPLYEHRKQIAIQSARLVKAESYLNYVDSEVFFSLARQISVDPTHRSQARAIAFLAAVNAQNQYIKNSLGDKFLKWEDLVPEGYRAVPIQPGNIMYSAYTIPERMANALLSDHAMTLGLTADDLNKITAFGPKHVPIVVPEEVANQMERLSEIKGDSFAVQLDSMVVNGVRRWKGFVLLGPHRIVKYNLRNMSELDKVLFLNPSAASPKLVFRAAKELAGLFMGSHDISPDVKRWMELGGASTLPIVNEVLALGSEKEFKKFFEQQTNAASLVTAGWRWYWDKAGKISNYRESILRYSAYLAYLDQIKKNGRPNNYGGSNANEVKGITDPEAKAFRLAADLLGDYGDLSPVGQWMRDRPVPFWAFQETNFRTYFNGVVNLARDERLAGKTGLKLAKEMGIMAITRSPWMAVRLGRIAMLMAGMQVALNAWNYLLFRDEEDDLPEDVQKRPHIILGRLADGTVIYFDRLGTSSDILDWFGLDTIDSDLRDVLNNRKTIEELAIDMVHSPINKLVQSVSPVVKLPTGWITGKDTFPDYREPRTIRDQYEHTAKAFGLDAEYRWFAGRPSRGLGDNLLRNIAYTAEPGNASYYSTLDRKYKWGEANGSGGRGSFEGESPTSEAMRHYKQAVRFKDKVAAEKYLNQYFALGGTEKGMAKSIASLHPLSGLSLPKELRFLASLSEGEKDELAKAEKFAYESLMTPEQAEAIKSQRANRVVGAVKTVMINDGRPNPKTNSDYDNAIAKYESEQADIAAWLKQNKDLPEVQKAVRDVVRSDRFKSTVNPNVTPFRPGKESYNDYKERLRDANLRKRDALKWRAAIVD
jgi:hypothetical protein